MTSIRHFCPIYSNCVFSQYQNQFTWVLNSRSSAAYYSSMEAVVANFIPSTWLDRSSENEKLMAPRIKSYFFFVQNTSYYIFYVDWYCLKIAWRWLFLRHRNKRNVKWKFFLFVHQKCFWVFTDSVSGVSSAKFSLFCFGHHTFPYTWNTTFTSKHTPGRR